MTLNCAAGNGPLVLLSAMGKLWVSLEKLDGVEKIRERTSLSRSPQEPLHRGFGRLTALPCDYFA